MIFAYRTVTVYGTPFQGVSTNQTLPKCSPSEVFPSIRNAPDVIPLQPLVNNEVWAGSFSLAATKEIVYKKM